MASSVDAILLAVLSTTRGIRSSGGSDSHQTTDFLFVAGRPKGCGSAHDLRSRATDARHKTRRRTGQSEPGSEKEALGSIAIHCGSRAPDWYASARPHVPVVCACEPGRPSEVGHDRA